MFSFIAAWLSLLCIPLSFTSFAVSDCTLFCRYSRCLSYSSTTFCCSSWSSLFSCRGLSDGAALASAFCCGFAALPAVAGGTPALLASLAAAAAAAACRYFSAIFENASRNSFDVLFWIMSAHTYRSCLIFFDRVAASATRLRCSRISSWRVCCLLWRPAMSFWRVLFFRWYSSRSVSMVWMMRFICTMSAFLGSICARSSLIL
mmetsp:Transcript_7812/g.18867  ORF Transcript_7812/g.18867 Transcript_7812/m.18867 type:complete len:204 (+) Transcript_7812:505-1116(+)